MGKSAPSPPDPYATAQAQGQMNAETARTQARLNRADTYTPMGNVTYTELPEDRWRTDVALSPEQQAIYSQGAELSRQGGRLALDMMPEARTALSQPMAVDDADARNRATAGIMSRLEPQFARDRQALEGRLLSQGFQPGTEAYRQAADELNRSITDARMQADAVGSQESRNAAAFSNAQRGQRINELGMVFGLGPGAQTPQAQNVAQVGVNSPDLMSAVAQNYQTRAGNYQSEMAILGQLLSSAGRTLPFVKWSDRRLKRDVERIGAHRTGLPVYRFRYLWDDAEHIGFMADEVAAVMAEAVMAHPAGFAMVDYGRVLGLEAV